MDTKADMMAAGHATFLLLAKDTDDASVEVAVNMLERLEKREAQRNMEASARCW